MAARTVLDALPHNFLGSAPNWYKTTPAIRVVKLESMMALMALV